MEKASKSSQIKETADQIAEDFKIQAMGYSPTDHWSDEKILSDAAEKRILKLLVDIS